MCLVYWAALVNMGSMLTGDMKVRKDSDSICCTQLGISVFESDLKHLKQGAHTQL